MLLGIKYLIIFFTGTGLDFRMYVRPYASPFCLILPRNSYAHKIFNWNGFWIFIAYKMNDVVVLLVYKIDFTKYVMQGNRRKGKAIKSISFSCSKAS